MSLSITSYIINLIANNKDRINKLENDVFKIFRQVLSRDFRSLSEILCPDYFIKDHVPELLPVEQI